MAAPEQNIAVSVRDLERRFGNFIAVNRVSFDVAKGEIFGFLGPNGSGKSTTIRMLTGILAPSGGAGTVAGFDVRTQAEKIKAHIGYMSQRFSLYEDLTVEENIDFYSGIYRIPKKRRRERKEWVIGMGGLAEHRASRTAILSGGWKQRLALGCAVLHEPPVIFLDEPTSGVDPLSRRRFWELIYDLSARGVTVFVTTHYMEEAERLCDRLVILDAGHILACDTPRALINAHIEPHVVELIGTTGGEAPPPELSGGPGGRLHRAGDLVLLYTAAPRLLLERLDAAGQRYLHRPANLEDVFLKLTGHELRD